MYYVKNAFVKIINSTKKQRLITATNGRAHNQ